MLPVSLGLAEAANVAEIVAPAGSKVRVLSFAPWAARSRSH